MKPASMASAFRKTIHVTNAANTFSRSAAPTALPTRIPAMPVVTGLTLPITDIARRKRNAPTTKIARWGIGATPVRRTPTARNAPCAALRNANLWNVKMSGASARRGYQVVWFFDDLGCEVCECQPSGVETCGDEICPEDWTCQECPVDPNCPYCEYCPRRFACRRIVPPTIPNRENASAITSVSTTAPRVTNAS